MLGKKRYASLPSLKTKIMDEYTAKIERLFYLKDNQDLSLHERTDKINEILQDIGMDWYTRGYMRCKKDVLGEIDKLQN